MIAALAVGFVIWGLALLGGLLIAGPVGLVVVLAFFALAGVLGVLHQRELEDKYIVIRKDEDRG